MRTHLRKIFLTNKLDTFPTLVTDQNCTEIKPNATKCGRPKNKRSSGREADRLLKERVRKRTKRSMETTPENNSRLTQDSLKKRARSSLEPPHIKKNRLSKVKGKMLDRLRITQIETIRKGVNNDGGLKIYNHSQMRTHLRKIFLANKLDTFPTLVTDQNCAEIKPNATKCGRPKYKRSSGREVDHLLKERVRKHTKRSMETTSEKNSRLTQDSLKKRARRSLEPPNIKNRLSKVKGKRQDRRSITQIETIGKGVNNVNNDSEFVEENFLGDMNVRCFSCGSKNFLSEMARDKKFTYCCQKGKVDLSSLPTHKFPDFLKKLMTGNDPDAKHFMDHIRSYNSAFSFASMGSQIKLPRGNGPYCFRIHGQIYHRAVTLHPVEGEPRKYAQLYILDIEEATKQRMEIPENINCKQKIMDKIGSFILENNDLAKALKMLHEVEKEAIEEARQKGIAPADVRLAIRQDRSSDPRTYNAPRVNEVAVVFQNKDGEPPFERDLIIHLRPKTNNPEDKFQRISILHPSLEPMTYPLLFPYGDSGWHPNILIVDSSRNVANHVHNHYTKIRKRVTQMAYYGYRFAIRDEFNPFLNAGKLTQQYIVDGYVKMESNRLKWIKEHQKELHAESYQGLMDHLHSRANEKGLVAGRPIILPSSFIGSPRNMQQNYQDAMSIVRKFGKPDLFITMTCNPKWREITENLEKHQKVEHRPDLVARVFHLKLKELLHDVSKKHILGKVIAKVHVIEFQKRGLPHAHMLFILSDEYKSRDQDAINKIVSAEIPDKSKHPLLYEIVLKNMIHGPCGDINPRSPCMGEGKCTKDYPKPFQPETISNLDGYPRYRRRDDGQKHIVTGGAVVDNRWVVPYNPYLCLKYNCHINVEVCATVKSVKYLFKYVYKGHDCAKIEISNITIDGTGVYDEVKQFLDTRYVSAPEAAWRLFGKPMHHQSHTIVRLAVHLPNQQTVCFHPTTDIRSIVEKSDWQNSTLLAYFRLNEINEHAKSLFYFQVPEHFLYTKNTGWKERKNDGKYVIGRMYTVSIVEGERYFLRMLLLHVLGATSFQYLRTVGNIVYNTFKEAAQARGLLEDDRIWEQTVAEAVAVHMPSPLRQLFAFVCVFGCPTDPCKIWKNYLQYFTEDIVKKHGCIENECSVCENFALLEVEDILILHGKRCIDFRLKEPVKIAQEKLENCFNIDKERTEGEKLRQSLNVEQTLVFQTIMHAVCNNSDRSNCYFLDGPGGSGKTHLYKTLLCTVRGRGDTALPVASTGIAANLLKGGRTYHSLFKLPVPLVETSTSSMRMTSTDAIVIRDAKLIVWDESTMASCHALNAVDKLLRSIMQNDYPFGGKVILLGGDFRQCLPVVPHGSRSQIIETSIKYCPLWSQFQLLTLKFNVRSADLEYSNWILAVGNGKQDCYEGLEEELLEMPENILAVKSIIDETFGHFLKPEDISKFSNFSILCPRNDEASLINEKVLQILEGEVRTYLSVDSIECDDEAEKQNYPMEFLNSLTPSGLPPHVLNLKIGCIVMLLRNLNTKQGLCNGTRLTVTRLESNLIHATILTGSSQGNPCFIPRVILAPSSQEIPFILKRQQFPVKLAFSMTINKSQGQTLDRVGIHLPKPVFSHGQLYVALSRVRRQSDIKVEIVSGPKQGALLSGSKKILTKNIVYNNIL